MYNESSYQVQNIAGHLETEINRLGAQVDLFWHKELKHYQEYGLKDGMKVVELGSGPGFLTEKLLQVFPSLHVVGVEIDPLLVQVAERRLERNFPGRYQIVTASVMDTGLPVDTYDFAITRLLIEHLTNPVAAAREVHRILKPGAWGAFVDNDFEMHMNTFPSIPEIRELYEAYSRARSSEGGNPRIGRELPLLLRKAGFSSVDFEVICAHSAVVGDEVFFKAQGVGIPSKLVQDGFLSSKLLGKIAYEWRRIMKDDDHAIMRQLYMGVGQKALVPG